MRKNKRCDVKELNNDDLKKLYELILKRLTLDQTSKISAMILVENLLNQIDDLNAELKENEINFELKNSLIKELKGKLL